ncbi:MAG: energy transducer TonB [Candidatus Eisenbacteria bacterium]
MRVTANSLFKQKYNKYLEFSILGAIVIHAAVFYFAPPYVPSPYQLTERKLEVIDLPPNIEVPPPPEDIERPQLPQEAEISDDVDTEETIAPTEFDPFEPPVIPSQPEAPNVFVAFDTYPEVIRRVSPEYPDLAKEAEAEGSVQVEVIIDETGRVVDARVKASDTIQALNQAALEAARKFLFKPAKQRDVPVKCRIVIPFRFTLGG